MQYDNGNFMSRIRAHKKKKVFVGMSGGVDSSVAALLLARAGYDVTGVFIKCYNIDGCAERDAEDARRVASHIGIPFYVMDLEKEYKKRVVDYMIDGYARGVTPNPDVMCNKEIKFGLFLKKALSMGADYVATGHYVRRLISPYIFAKSVSGATPKSYSLQKHKASHYYLGIAKDTNKDQSYFLWTLTQYELQHSLFPIGHLTKPEVRVIARKAGLPTAEKKDSQGICFLGMFDVRDFLKQHIRTRRGEVINAEGEVIGSHEGASLYTIGQRHGLLFNAHASRGSKKGVTPAYYVARKDIAHNIIVVGRGERDPILFMKSVILRDVNILMPIGNTTNVMVRTRYRQPLFVAVLKKIKEKKGNSYELVFNTPQRFVAEGQSAVFYKKGGGLVGGGIMVYNG